MTPIPILFSSSRGVVDIVCFRLKVVLPAIVSSSLWPLVSIRLVSRHPGWLPRSSRGGGCRQRRRHRLLVGRGGRQYFVAIHGAVRGRSLGPPVRDGGRSVPRTVACLRFRYQPKVRRGLAGKSCRLFPKFCEKIPNRKPEDGRMRSLALVQMVILCSLNFPGWAEPIGVLSRLRPGQVTFLEGSTGRHFSVNQELGRKLAKEGLGSRWEFWATGSHLDSVVPRGRDRNLNEGLQVLRQFCDKVSQERWKEAYQMLAPSAQSVNLQSFVQNWSRQSLSADSLHDWDLQECQEDAITVEIVSVQGNISLIEEDIEPTYFRNVRRLRKRGLRWFIESY